MRPCPDLNIASQGDTLIDAKENLLKTLQLFFERASPEEIEKCLHGAIYITQIKEDPKN